MVALGASARSATPPIPIFSGSVLTSIKGAAIHHDGGRCGCVKPCFLGPLGPRLDRQTSSQKRCTCTQVPALLMIDMAPNRTWQKENMTDGAKQNMTKRSNGEQLECWESFVSFLCM
jgi:hypothetical protein